MTLRLAIAYLHLLTLAFGFAAIWGRARALQKLKDKAGLADVFMADNFWGLAALLWIVTGLWRAFGGLEKGSAYYLHSRAFIVKMCLFALVFIVEIKPMVTFIKWRIKNKKGEPINLKPAGLFARLSYIQLALLTLIVLCAAAMARGEWYQ